MPTTGDVRAAAVQAPPPAVESVPSKTEAAQPSSGGKPELSDWQKRMLVDSDKARDDKARTKKAERAGKAQPPRKKTAAGLLNGGDKFDPLNGAL